MTRSYHCVVDKENDVVERCLSEALAMEAKWRLDDAFPDSAPHRAVELVELAVVESIVREFIRDEYYGGVDAQGLFDEFQNLGRFIRERLEREGGGD